MCCLTSCMAKKRQLPGLQSRMAEHLVVLEQLVVDADGFCGAAHAIVQLRLKIQPGNGSVIRLLLNCCKSLLKLLKPE